MLDVGQEDILKWWRGPASEVYESRCGGKGDRPVGKSGAFLRRVQHDVCVDL